MKISGKIIQIHIGEVFFQPFLKKVFFRDFREFWMYFDAGMGPGTPRMALVIPGIKKKIKFFKIKF